MKTFLKDLLKLKQEITDGELAHVLTHSTDEELKAALANLLSWQEEARDYAMHFAYLEERDAVGRAMAARQGRPW